MKRLLLWNVLGTVLIIGTIGLCTSCSAFESDEFILKKEAKEVKLVELTKFGKTERYLIIPNEVTYIDANSFNGCHASILNFKYVNSRRITICEHSFANFKNIKKYLIRYNDLLMGKKLIKAKVDESKIFVVITQSEQWKELWNKLGVSEKVTVIFVFLSTIGIFAILLCMDRERKGEKVS